ncbi:Oxidoreductase sirO [Lachnellula suecica]|uniref:Oxidoreductase sirO n=1 Tax=Lachnellula suecica TaxID=602035 RepID=A0A8T9CM19_9HELO|nr:Oxidoreductase sirO [Lachnellula suecica]
MVKVIVGMMGSSVGAGSTSLSTPAQVQEFLDCAKHHGVRELDTARVYAGGKSEDLLGAVNAHKQFSVSTKAPAFSPKSLTEGKIIANCNLSLKALGQEKIDIYYLHGPDRETPLEEQCRAIGKLYSEGKFEKFGVSNISPAEVQKIHDICTQHGYPLPSVYQGGYNPLQRGAEDQLFPILRNLKMNFYAYSPLAGGALAKKIDDVLKPAPGTRFDAMKIFGDMYLKKPTVDSLAVLKAKCDQVGITVMEATMRWFLHHSPLKEDDGVILGASSTRQIEESLATCEKGPLPAGLELAFDDL